MSESNFQNESIVLTKTYEFSLEIIKTYKVLNKELQEFTLFKQMLRSGTSIGANVNEAISAQSKRDFVHKLSIALKESRETLYWLKLLSDSEYLTDEIFVSLKVKNEEINKILSSIMMTTKQKYFNQKN
ncbi:MAG: four helix bundle protein [Chitinophagaceae bacterium]|nr:four helix bundle protein [Chitinophagaceae bacterium]